MDSRLDEADLKIWGRYRNYQDEARLEYGRLLWRRSDLRESLLQHWLDERHPWHERFAEKRELIEEILSSSLESEALNRKLLSRGTSLRCVTREIPPVFGSFFKPVNA